MSTKKNQIQALENGEGENPHSTSIHSDTKGKKKRNHVGINDSEFMRLGGMNREEKIAEKDRLKLKVR